METIFRKSALITIFAVMALYLIIIMFSNTDELFHSISLLKIEFLPIIFGLQFISFFLKSLRQKEFLKKLKIEISLRKNFLLFLSGLSMLMTPGGTGGAIKFQLLKNEYGHSRRKTIPIVLHERYHDFLALTTLMIIFSIFYSILASQIIMIISSVLILLIFVIIKNGTLAKLFFGKLQKIKFVNKFLGNPAEIIVSLQSLISNRPFLTSWIVSLVAVFLDLIAVFLIFEALNFEIGFFQSSQIFITSILIGVFSLLPAGIGVTEGSYLALLTSYGFEVSFASAAVLSVRLMTLWFSTIVGFITIKFLKL